MKKYLTAALCLIAAPALRRRVPSRRLDPALDSVIAPGTKIEKVATGFIFIEGPMWKDGKLWFSRRARRQGAHLRSQDRQGHGGPEATPAA